MKKVFLLTTLLTLAIVSCNREDSHVVVTENPEQPEGGAIIELNTDSVADQKFGDTHLYAFDAEQKMIAHQYYPTQKELSKGIIQIKGGTYTFVAVVNVGEDFSPATTSATETFLNVTQKQLLDYLQQAADDYPDMLSGMANHTIVNHQVVRIKIPLSKNAGTNKPDAGIEIDPGTNEWEEGESANGNVLKPNN